MKILGLRVDKTGVFAGDVVALIVKGAGERAKRESQSVEMLKRFVIESEGL